MHSKECKLQDGRTWLRCAVRLQQETEDLLGKPGEENSCSGNRRIFDLRRRELARFLQLFWVCGTDEPRRRRYGNHVSKGIYVDGYICHCRMRSFAGCAGAGLVIGGDRN